MSLYRSIHNISYDKDGVPYIQDGDYNWKGELMWGSITVALVLAVVGVVFITVWSLT